MAHPGGVILNDLSTYPAYQPTFNPIDYPCVVIADFDGAGPPGYDSIQVRCGAEGVVRNFTTNRTAVFIFLPRSMDRIVDGNKSTGWVPASHVLIGSVRKYGNYVTTTQVAPRPSGTLGQATLPPGCSRWVMNSAMYLATLLRNKDDLKFVPELFFTDMDTIGIAKTVCDLEAKVGLSNATFMRQLSVPDFTVQSLTEGAHRVQAGTDEVAKNWKGWYLFLYNLAGSLMAAYGGQTGNAKKRFNDHNQKRRKARLPGFVGPYHYSRVKHATGAEMILCAELPLPKERDIFEQLMMHQLGLEADFVQNYKLLTVDEGQDHMTVDVPLGRIAADSLSTSSSATRAMQSKVLLEIFRKTHWPEGTVSPSFGVTIPLNHASPLASYGAGDGLVWTMQSIPGFANQFRRPAVKVIDGQGSTFAAILIKGEHQFQLKWSTGEGPKLGASVYPVVEIMTNGQEHAYPFARLPTVGPFNNWQNANKLGIRLDWEEDGVHMSRYFQAAQVFSFATTLDGKTFPGAVKAYANVEGLRRALQRERVANPEPWFRDYGRPIVYEISVEHLTQKWSLEMVPLQEPITIVDGDFKSMVQIAQELKSAGFRGKSINPKDKPSLPRNRKTCDRCHLMNQDEYRIVVTTRGPCEPAPGNPRTCIVCSKFGIPCTWTDSDILLGDETMQQALCFQPVKQDVLMSLGDPVITVA